MTLDIGSENFKRLIKEKEGLIQVRTQESLHENENFKRLHGLLVSYKQINKIVGFRAILIAKADLEALQENAQETIFVMLDSEDATANNHIIVDRNLTITAVERKAIESSNAARRIYSELSHDYCVFLISSQDLTYFIDGHDFGDAIFFTQADHRSYIELKDMSEMPSVLTEYREHLKIRDTYTKFFVSKSHRKALYADLVARGEEPAEAEPAFLERSKQLLENKPEDRFREDLRVFLRQKMKIHLLSREYILDDFRRLDILINDELGDLHLIEVKWVGISIHPSGKEFGTAWTENDINPAGINQSVGYIRKLFESNQQINRAYLAVFNAREEDLPDTYDGFNEANLEDGHREYFSRFTKISDFKIRNLHPN
jgi:hypothetical protein